MSQDTQTIKYRLIGAAVILFSLLMAWWLFLDHDVKRYQDVRRTMPEPLLIERFEVEEATPIEPLSIQEVIEPQRSQPVDVNVSSAPREPVKDAAPVAKNPAPVAQPTTPYANRDATGAVEAWVVQAASFGNQDNARQLQQRLLNAKLPAYVKVFNLPDGKRYRVLLGPKLNRQQAENLLPRLQKEFQINGQILRYQAGYEE